MNWHYSKSMPAGKLVKIGVWENEVFVGVAIFSLGSSKDLGAAYGLKSGEICELTRMALSKHSTPVSKVMSIAVRMLRKQSPGIRLIVSFAARDQEHLGTIYQASNWLYFGQTNPRYEFIYKGRRTTERTISEVVKKYRMTKKELAEKGYIKLVPSKPKFRYLMPMDKKTKARLLPMAKSYPTKKDV